MSEPKAAGHGRTAFTPSRAIAGASVLDDPLVDELLAARLVANLATFNRDGTIHLVAVWFARDASTIVLATGSRSQKVRNAERDPRATVMVHDSRAGYEVCGFTFSGRIEVIRGQKAIALVERVHRRYLAASAGRFSAVREALAADDVALRFHPEKALTWDERGSAQAQALAGTGEAHPLEPTSPRPVF